MADDVELMDVPTSALREPLLRGDSMLLKVGRGDAALEREARGDGVRRVQDGLLRLGLTRGVQVGVLDRATADGVKRFQKSHGLRTTGIVDGRTLLALDAALQRHAGAADVDALEHLDPDRPEYARAIAAWPDDQPIWPRLRSQAARLRLLRFSLRRDETDAIPYEGHFPNLCTGFAAQVYARLSARARLSDRVRAFLKQGPQVDSGFVPVKLRLPLLMVSSRGHMFNALQVGADPGRIESYLFVEPQRDQVVAVGDPFWRRHVERHGISLIDLVDCDERGAILTSHVQGFLLAGSGEMRAISTERATNFGKDLAIAESDLPEYEFQVGRLGGFAAFARARAREQWRLTDGELLEVGRTMVGRRVRERPDDVATPVTPQRYARWVDRADLLAGLG